MANKRFFFLIFIHVKTVYLVQVVQFNFGCSVEWPYGCIMKYLLHYCESAEDKKKRQQTSKVAKTMAMTRDDLYLI